MPRLQAMKVHTEGQFLEWAAAQGIRFDPRWPHSKSLHFDPDPELRRFWVRPEEAIHLPHFVATLLRLLEPTGPWYVWSIGWWPPSPDSDGYEGSPEYRVYAQILEGAGVPLHGPHALEFKDADSDKLLTVLFANLLFGWHTGHDLYVIPDTARYIAKTDHHDVVHVVSRSEEDLEAHIKGMEKSGYRLPTELPDATFKPQAWITGDERE